MWALRLGTLFFAGLGVLGGKSARNELVWVERAELPRPVAGYMAGASHGNLLIVGGSYWENGKKHQSDEVQVFNPRSNSWSSGPSLPHPRSDAASATLDNALYIFGGAESNAIRSDCLVLQDNQWRTLPHAEIPEPREYANAVAYNGWVYLLGGMSDAHDYKTASNKFWRWRPGANGWQTLPSLPGPGRINFAMAQIDGDLYVFGGATSEGATGVKNLDDAYRFNPGEKKWARLRNLPVANRSWWAVSLGDSALVLAGYTNNYADAVYRYSPKRGLWMIGTLPHALADPKFFLIHHEIIGTGGEAGSGVRGKWTVQATIPVGWLKESKQH